MNGYNIIIPDVCAQGQPEVTLPVMDVLQSLGHTPVTMSMRSIHDMYRTMRYQRHGCYEIFQFYVQDMLKKGHVDFGFCAGLAVILEDAEKQETHHLLEECSIPSMLYLHSRDHGVIDELKRVGAPDWKHTFLVVTSEYLAEMIRKAGIERVTAIPPGTSFRIFYPADDIPENAAYRIIDNDERLTSGFDVSFIGSYGVRRAQCIQALVDAGIEVAVFGDEAWKDSPVFRQWRNSVRYLHEVNTVYNSSKINLDLPHDACLLSDYISYRVQDCLAAGGFLLTHRRPAIEQILEPGHDIALYEDVDSLVKSVQYYLDNVDERTALTRKGRRRVQTEGGWERRMAQLLPQMEMHLLTAAPAR